MLLIAASAISIILERVRVTRTFVLALTSGIAFLLPSLVRAGVIGHHAS